MHLLLPIALYAVLFAGAAFGPLRWSIACYLLLSTVDFGNPTGSVGLLNMAKAIVLPVYLLWRFRAYAGHGPVILAPIAWILFSTYAALCISGSYFPAFAVKLVGHMAALFLICLVFLRAAKAGYLMPRVVVPVAAGALFMGVLRSIFMPRFQEEADRFTAFSSAQAFAAFLCALYCIALCSKTLRRSTRVTTCLLLLAALLLDGSRVWFAGTAIATLFALLISGVKPWIKICTSGVSIIAIALGIGLSDRVIGVLNSLSGVNRIAATITAAYEGETNASGLGTFELRRMIDDAAIQRIQESTVRELIFGHGTSNSAAVTGSLIHSGVDPNRTMHDEWLRILYEWGLIGLILWLIFFASITIFAIQGVRRDPHGFAKPLLVYLPAFALALATENMLAGAGSDVTTGFLLALALASISHREWRRRLAGFHQNMLGRFVHTNRVVYAG
jgi:O-antigen ligase